jgi:hypothetical protein
MSRRAYRLTIEGELGELAREVFDRTAVTAERGNTVVVVRDQAELLVSCSGSRTSASR